jgi:hypothetical protein
MKWVIFPSLSPPAFGRTALCVRWEVWSGWVNRGLCAYFEKILVNETYCEESHASSVKPF